MREFSAAMFFWSGGALEGIRTDCLIGSLPVEGSEPIFVLSRKLDEKARDHALKLLKNIEQEFRATEMHISADTVNELIDALAEGRGLAHNYQWLLDHVKALEKLARKELRGKFFLYISTERAKFWPKEKQPNCFGNAVANAFPSSTGEVIQAGICLAIHMVTASVFHLMRVLEIGLTVLGSKFGVSLEHTNWGPAIEQIEKKIRHMHEDPTWKAMSDCKDQQAFYAQAASYLGIVKDAWRNYTMHGRSIYTEAEGELIFNNVKGFMQKLAERLHE